MAWKFRNDWNFWKNRQISGKYFQKPICCQIYLSYEKADADVSGSFLSRPFSSFLKPVISKNPHDNGWKSRNNGKCFFTAQSFQGHSKCRCTLKNSIFFVFKKIDFFSLCSHAERGKLRGWIKRKYGHCFQQSGSYSFHILFFRRRYFFPI